MPFDSDTWEAAKAPAVTALRAAAERLAECDPRAPGAAALLDAVGALMADAHTHLATLRAVLAPPAAPPPAGRRTSPVLPE